MAVSLLYRFTQMSELFFFRLFARIGLMTAVPTICAWFGTTTVITVAISWVVVLFVVMVVVVAEWSRGSAS